MSANEQQIEDSSSEEDNTPRVTISKKKKSLSASQTSLVATSSKNTSNTSDTTQKLIDTINKHLNKITKEKSLSAVHSRVTTVQKLITGIQYNMEQAQQERESQYQTIATQSTRIQELRDHIHTISEKLPSVEDIQDAVQVALNKHTTALHEATALTTSILDKLEDIPTIITHLEDNTKQLEALESNIQQSATSMQNNQENTQVKQQQQQQQQEQQPSDQDSRAPKHQRIAIIKPTNRRMTGRDLHNTIKQHHFRTAATITDIKIHPYSIEALCKDPQDKETLKRQLQTQDSLKDILTVTDKIKPMQKVILQNIHQDYKYEDIIETLTDIYKMTQEDVTYMRETNSRHANYKNIIVLMDPALLRSLIIDRGFRLGFTMIQARPYTSIQRCRTCQQYTHNTKACKNKPVCETCGEEHEEHEATETCTKPPHCINCTKHNTKFGTAINTEHKASDTYCQTYRHTYTHERERLDRLYDLQPNPISAPAPPRNTATTREGPYNTMQQQRPTTLLTTPRPSSSNVPQPQTGSNTSRLPNRANQPLISHMTPLPQRNTTHTKPDQQAQRWQAGPPTWMRDRPQDPSSSSHQQQASAPTPTPMHSKTSADQQPQPHLNMDTAYQLITLLKQTLLPHST